MRLDTSIYMKALDDRSLYSSSLSIPLFCKIKRQIKKGIDMSGLPVVHSSSVNAFECKNPADSPNEKLLELLRTVRKLVVKFNTEVVRQDSLIEESQTQPPPDERLVFAALTDYPSLIKQSAVIQAKLKEEVLAASAILNAYLKSGAVTRAQFAKWKAVVDAEIPNPPRKF